MGGWSAARGSRECSADGVHSRGVELGVIDSVSSAFRTVRRLSRLTAQGDGHSVLRSEFDFGVDPANRAGHERDDYVAQSWEGRVARENDNGAPALLL